MKKLPLADGLIVRLAHQVDEEILASAPNLKMVATATTGLNHIDQQAAQRQGVAVLSLKGETEFLAQISATAEHTWGLLLALIRQTPEAISHVREGKWDRNEFVGRELSGRTLGILGYGRLGRIVAEYARAFRMNVLAHDPNPISKDPGVSYVTLPELLQSAEVLSVHVSLDASTRGMIGPKEFALMRRGVYLVNTARGEIIDEPAFLNALEKGWVAGAAVDVLCNESHTADRQSGKMVEYAQTHTNLLITPHIGGCDP